MLSSLRAFRAAFGPARSPGAAIGAVCAILAAGGCAPKPATAATPTMEAQIAALVRLAELETLAEAPRTDRVRLRIDAPYLPAPIEARGALAVDAARGMRLVLLGPGGTTALDFWASAERHRLSLPELGTDVRGDARSPTAMRRALPIQLFRWWMLDPFGGELLFAVREPGGVRAVLSRQRYVTHLRLRDDGGLEAHRVWRAERDGAPHVDEEWLELDAYPCGLARYEQRSTRIVVDIRCEESRNGVAPRALEEPSGTQASR
jgi:hypothetical protein